MTKKNFGARLDASVKTQDEAVLARFEKADSVLSRLPPPGAKATQPKSTVVRHSFSMSEGDYTLIETLRKAAAMEGSITTASEVIRAAIHAVGAYNGSEIIAAIGKLEHLRAGPKT